MKKNIYKTSSLELIKDIYQQDYQPRLPNGRLFEIPLNGSLGLLATGYTGLIAWRKKRGMKQ